MMNFKKIENQLINFQKPGRYIGGELGIPSKDMKNSPVKVAISYPDVYEIGMSNQGIKIIYDRINRIDFACCERVFSPWIDFESFLRENNLPLFSLETKTPIKQFHFLGISLQYELLFSNFLNLLNLSQIEIFSEKRSMQDPIIICGGPCSVNPAPFSPFSDLFLIGEAEDILEPLIKTYYTMMNSYNRQEIIQELSKINGIYSPRYSTQKVTRQVYTGFSEDLGSKIQLIPNIEIIQDKFVVEIMRGCPNKCRFCQAGMIYKPYREKNIDLIMDIIDDGLKKTGANEVTLSSLSSADYSEIIPLTETFTATYNQRGISFSLPSIRVESFDENLLTQISSVRKSGLTFAIETGSSEGQIAINKPVLFEKIAHIIEYSIQHGWKLIKLYFMLGLPTDQLNYNLNKDINDLTHFIDQVLKLDKKLKINLNVAVFVPKAHTPFQYAGQLTLEESLSAFEYLEKYYSRSRVAIKKHDPYCSYIEGFIARGDEKVGLAVYEAYLKGAKFDGWKEMFNYDYYLTSLNQFNIHYNSYLAPKNEKDELPWNNIDIGVDPNFFHNELIKADKPELTKSCKEECDPYCYICKKGEKKKKDADQIISKQVIHSDKEKKELMSKEKIRYILEFNKTGLYRFIGHIDLMKYFEKLFLRAGIAIYHSEGYNPHPKMQFSSALQLGTESHCELLEFYTLQHYPENELFDLLKSIEHNELSIRRLRQIPGNKKFSLFDHISYSIYSLIFEIEEFNKIKFIYDKYQGHPYSYQITKKNKVLSGYYQNYIHFLKLDHNLIVVKVDQIPQTPSLWDFINDVFKDIPIAPCKEKIYMHFENQDRELYEYNP